MRRCAAAASLLALSACSGPARTPFAPEGEADLFAILELDAQGNLRAATGVLPFAESASVFTRGEVAYAVGWRASELAALGAPGPEALAAAPLEAAAGCRPRLPTPRVAVRLGEGDVDPATLPPLGVAWLDETCPAVEPSAFAFDLTCKKFRCPLTVKRKSTCQYEFELDCEVGTIPGTLWPDGTLCLEPDPALACAPADAAPPRAAALSCAAPEACRVEAYVDQVPELTVEPIRLLDVPPYSPPPDLIGQLVLPPVASRFLGYAHDLAIADGRVVVSLGPGTAFTGCRAEGLIEGALDLYDAETLAHLGRAPVAGCVPRLASGPGGLLGLRDAAFRFELLRLSQEGVVEEAVLADPRVGPGPGEPPLLHTLDARPSFFEVVGDTLVAAVVTAAPVPGTKVFTWDAATLAPRTRAFIEDGTIVAGARVDDRTVVLGATARSGYYTLDLTSGQVRGPVALPADLERDDNVTCDVAWAEDSQRVLLTLSRKNASLLELDPTGVRTRAVIFDGDARPMATRPFPGRGLALVAASYSTDQLQWPASLHLYDLETSRFRPGQLLVGHGAPGRVLPDARGRLWVLLPWDAQLLRVTLR
jgi:hypothetical protein